MNSQTQIAEVNNFFSRHAKRYAHFYSHNNSLHSQRLKLALEDSDLDGKSVLDIGCGTGALWDIISKNEWRVNYLGIDANKEMLDHSTIPESQRICDTFLGADINGEFDFIFALGLTPYLTEPELEKLNLFVTHHLSPEGVALISFANAHSILNRCRRFMSSVLPTNQKYTLTSNMKLLSTSAVQVSQSFNNIEEFTFFNHLFHSGHVKSNLPERSPLYSNFLIKTKATI